MTLVGTVSSFPAAGEGALLSVLHLMALKPGEVAWDHTAVWQQGRIPSQAVRLPSFCLQLLY